MLRAPFLPHREGDFVCQTLAYELIVLQVIVIDSVEHLEPCCDV